MRPQRVSSAEDASGADDEEVIVREATVADERAEDASSKLSSVPLWMALALSFNLWIGITSDITYKTNIVRYICPIETNVIILKKITNKKDAHPFSGKIVFSW